MDQIPNPFRPGAGRVPPELAGRSGIIDEFAGMLWDSRQTGEGQRPWALSGLRGVGKTVLLNQFGREAQELGLLVVKVEASSTQSLATALSKQLNLTLRRVISTSEKARQLWMRAASVLKSFQLRVDPSGVYTFGIELEAEPGVADSGDLAVDLQELLEAIGAAARDVGSTLLVMVDELQDAAASELAALNVALHNIGQNPFPVPVVFVGAGLPSLPGVLADATSYAERLYDFRIVGLLDDLATRAALTVPTRENGVDWNDAALGAVATATGGYPYLIQACGSHVWAVRSSDTISLDDALIGVDLARAELDQGLYRSRWERATPAQQAFMRAMAEDADKSAIGRLAARLGRKTTDLSVARRELIRNGHIYAPERGYVAFTVPGMATYIERQEI